MLVIKHSVSKKSGKDYFVLCLRMGNYDLMLTFKDKDIIDVVRFYKIPFTDVYNLPVGGEVVID